MTTTTTTSTTTTTALAALRRVLIASGAAGIPAVRVSSARARGRARRYAYWGAVRYRLVIGVHDAPCFRPEDHARSDRRSTRLAERDAQAIAAREGRILLSLRPGYLDEPDAARALAAIAARRAQHMHRRPPSR
jgi:hypothetical protein